MKLMSFIKKMIKLAFAGRGGGGREGDAGFDSVRSVNFPQPLATFCWNLLLSVWGAVFVIIRSDYS